MSEDEWKAAFKAALGKSVPIGEAEDPQEYDQWLQNEADAAYEERPDDDMTPEEAAEEVVSCMREG